MAKFVLRKLIPTVVSVGIFAPVSYFVYQEYIKSSTYSNFEVAADRLGFNGYKCHWPGILAQKNRIWPVILTHPLAK